MTSPTPTPSPPDPTLKHQIITKHFSSYCPIANVAEYFYILGLDSSTVFNEPFPNFTSSALTPCLISQFPPFIRPYSSIDKSILITHCFPHGFKIINSTTQPDTEVFHFSLDNLLYLDDVPKLYFTALLFYEPLSAYKKLRKTFNDNLRSCKATTAQRARSAMHKQSKPFMQRSNNVNTSKPLYHRSNTVNRCKPYIDIDNIYSTTNTVSTRNSSSNNNKPKDEDKYIYVPKVLCISSRCPFPREFHKVLKVYYDYAFSSSIKYPIEKLIEVLTLNIPLPTPGMVTYRYNLPNNKSVSFSRTEINKRNIISYKMSTILNFQDKDILDIFRFLLYEHPILFFSKDKDLLTNVVNTFLELLFPFKYQYPHIAMLPVINFGLIEIEECFCFGINEEYSKDFFEKYHLYFIHQTIQIADIDNGVLRVHTHDHQILPMIKLKDLNEKHKDELRTLTTLQCGDLHKNFKQKLSSKLAALRKALTQGVAQSNNERFIFKVGNIDDNEERDEKEVNERHSTNEEITDMFLEYINALIMDYPKALHQAKCKDVVDRILNAKKKATINELFNDEAIDLHGDKTLTDLMRTKLFYDFIERNYLLNSIEDRVTFLFLKDMANTKSKRSKSKKDNKQDETAFSSKQSITFRLPRYFTKDELYYIELQHTLNSPLMYFQHVSNDNAMYYLFPKLLYDDSFFPSRITSPSKPLNVDLGFKTRLAELLNSKVEKIMKYDHAYAERFTLSPTSKFASNKLSDYSYLNMLYMFAMVFYYCEDNEKHFRFYEMLDVIRKLSYIDRATLSLLFASVVEHGTEFMAIKLYETIQEYGFIPKYSEYAYLCNKLSCGDSHMKRNQLQCSKLTLIYYFKDQNNDNQFYESTQENINSIQRRTFGYGGNDNEVVLFDMNVTCSHCKANNVDAVKYTLQYDKMDTQHQMAPCMLCNQQIIPKMTVTIGNSSNNNKVSETYEMCNPYYIYTFYMKEMIRDHRTKLPMEVLRNKYAKVFWNMVWYMYFTFSTFDILLTYKETEIQNRMRRLESFMSTSSEPKGSTGKVGLVPVVDTLTIQHKVMEYCYLSECGSTRC